MEYKSRVFQPERFSASSQDAISWGITQSPTQLSGNTTSTYGFNSFRLALQTSILKVSSLQLLRATIPNPFTSIPDNETLFFYYRWPQAYGGPVALPYLYFVRLLPSYYPREIFNDISNATTGDLSRLEAYPEYGFNRYFSNLQDLVDELNRSCFCDPVQAQPSDPLYAHFAPNDIKFGLDQTTNKIFFQGLGNFIGNNPAGSPQNNYYYAPADINDAFVRSLTNLINDYNATYLNPFFTYYTYFDSSIQRNLNLRLGYTHWANLARGAATVGATLVPQTAMTQIYLSRPSQQTLGNYVESTDSVYGLPNINSWSCVANSYADLVYSANCYVYSDIVSGSAYSSDSKAQLLCTIPMNAPTLGVSFYNAILNNPLTKIINDIYEMNFFFYTDTGQPFIFPNSAIVNMEIGFTF